MRQSNLVRTTLGPKGLDKILQPERAKDIIHVTNDGATILKNVVVENPAAKIVIDISKTQDDTVGDGTTTVAVLCGELLREAEKLITAYRIHPQIIIQGYRIACKVAIDTLLAKARYTDKDSPEFEQVLMDIAMTTLSSKLVKQEKEHFARMAVDAIKRLDGQKNIMQVRILKKPGGKLSDSYLAEGFILDKKIETGCKKRIENPRIMVANTSMNTDRLKIHGATVKTSSMAEMADVEEAEKQKLNRRIEKVIHQFKPDVFINRDLIYDHPTWSLVNAGIIVIEHADFSGTEQLSAVLNTPILVALENPETVQLGTCELVEEILIGEDTCVLFKGCPGKHACSIVLRGSSKHIVEEAERSMHDALCVLQEIVISKGMIWGGGYSEMSMAEAVDLEARRTPGKKSLAIEAFARALRQLPAIIADNAGLDSAELIPQLRAALAAQPDQPLGLNVETGEVDNMQGMGITECLRVKEQALHSAHEAAEQIIRIDMIVRAEKRERDPDMPY